MEPLSVFFILVPIGIAVGIFGALTGLGGGVLMVPILFHGIFKFSNPILDEIKYATTISSTVIIFIALSSSIAFSLQKRIDYIVGLVCIPFAIAGAYIGKYAQSLIEEDYVLVFFVILLLITAFRMIIKSIQSKLKAQRTIKANSSDGQEKVVSSDNNEPIELKSPRVRVIDKLTLTRTFTDSHNLNMDYKAKLFFTPLALVGGFVASMAGVGGGIIMVPVLNIFIGLPIHFSVATSVFIMIFTKSATVISAYTTPNIITAGIWWPYVAGLAIGVITGAQFGAYLAKRIKADSLKYLFASVLILVAIWTIVEWQLDMG